MNLAAAEWLDLRLLAELAKIDELPRSGTRRYFGEALDWEDSGAGQLNYRLEEILRPTMPTK
jgi:hypothetical protein